MEDAHAKEVSEVLQLSAPTLALPADLSERKLQL